MESIDGGDEPVLVEVELSAGPSVVLLLPALLPLPLGLSEPLLLPLPLGAGSFFCVFFMPSAQAGAASRASAAAAESKVVRIFTSIETETGGKTGRGAGGSDGGAMPPPP